MSSSYYTVIDYVALRNLGLRPLEYCVADLICICSCFKDSLYPGWCYLSNIVIAKLFGYTERTIRRTNTFLVNENIIEKNTLRYKRPTEKWYNEVDHIKDETNKRALVKTLRCYYCGISFLDAPIQVDHFIPRANNGSNYPENLVYACQSCNTLKNNMTGTEFATFLKRRVEMVRTPSGQLS